MRQAFAEPISAAETIARYVGKLVVALCEALTERGVGARRLDLVCYRIDGCAEAVRVGTASPVRDAKRLTRLLVEKIEKIDPGFGIETMTLAASIAEPFAELQATTSLVDEIVPDVSDLIDVLANRVGSKRLYRVVPVASDVPERSICRVDPRPRGGQIGAEAAAAVQAAGPDRGASMDVLAPGDLAPDWRGAAPVSVIAKADTLDEVIAEMLAQVLTKHGVPARTGDLSSEEGIGDARFVCLSYLEPLSTLHLRYAVRLARKRHAGSTVLLGIWREQDVAIGRALGRAARSDHMAPTIGTALSVVVAAARDAAAVEQVGYGVGDPPKRRLARAA